MTDTTQNTYRTSDLYYAAYLKVAGVPFVETVRDKVRLYFHFEVTDGMRELKNAFYNRTAKVPALSYADEIRTMKALTHSEDE